MTILLVILIIADEHSVIILIVLNKDVKCAQCSKTILDYPSMPASDIDSYITIFKINIIMILITLLIPSHNKVIKLNYECEEYFIKINDTDILIRTTLKYEAMKRFDTIVSLLNILGIHYELEYHI